MLAYFKWQLTSGKAKYQTNLFFDSIIEINEDKFSSVKKIKSDKSKEIKPKNGLLATANKNEEFTFDLELNPGRYSLRIKAAAPLKNNPSQMKTYMMLLSVSADYKVEFKFSDYKETSIKKTKNLKEEASIKKTYFSKDKKNSLSFGAGANYSYLNKRPDSEDKLILSLMKVPFFHLNYERDINSNMSWSFSTMLANGEVTKTTNLMINNNTYRWVISSLDFLYSGDNWIGTSSSFPLKWGLRGSFQSYSIPFVKNKTSDTNEKDIISLAFSTCSLGFDLKAKKGKKHLLEMMMRFSYPLSLASDMNTSQFSSFDGSLGWTLLKELSPFSWGIFWYGHWVQFNYKEDNSDPLLVNKGINQDLYSNLELRGTWNF